MKTRKSKFERTGARIRIRGAKAGDASRIAFLSTQLGYPVRVKEMAEYLKTVRRKRNQKIFVADLHGTVAGWLEVFIPPSVLNWGKAEVGALVVDAEKRGIGLGRKLLEAARDWCEAQGSQFIYLRSNVVRKEAHKFYTHAGYRKYKTQYVFRYLFRKR